MTNETLHVIRERSSCKAFAEELPEKEKIDAIAQAAITAPSALNKQPWQVIAVTDRTLIRELEEETIRRMGEIPAYKSFYDAVQSGGAKLFYNAPCMIVLPIDKANPYSLYDCGIVSQTVCLAAQSLDVGSRIVAICDLAFSGEKGEYFKQAMKFPEGYEFGLAVLLGKEIVHNAPRKPDLNKITYIG